MKAVLDAIWNEWDGDAPLKAVVPRFYLYGMVPSNAVMPYGVVRLVAGSQADTFNEQVEEATYQFNIYDNASDATNILAIFDAFVNVFDYAALTIVAWSTTWCKRELHQLTFEDGVHDLMLQYSIRCSQ